LDDDDVRQRFRSVDDRVDATRTQIDHVRLLLSSQIDQVRRDLTLLVGARCWHRHSLSPGCACSPSSSCCRARRQLVFPDDLSLWTTIKVSVVTAVALLIALLLLMLSMFLVAFAALIVAIVRLAGGPQRDIRLGRLLVIETRARAPRRRRPRRSEKASVRLDRDTPQPWSSPAEAPVGRRPRGDARGR
jgi:hypothetical protein